MPADVRLGDCLDVMRAMPADSVHAIVTDPPYGLGFMGKAWDDLPPGVEWAAECLRVLRPGGYLLAFGGTRTFHRLAVAVEDAGFEIRDSIAWLYGSGFPKSLDVSKAIDKAAGATREVTGQYASPEGTTGINSRDDEYGFGVGDMSKRLVTAPATDAARQWAGWGTTLKPAFEPVVVARKPLTGTVAANVQAWGTGALNIDACRVGMSDADRAVVNARSGTGAAPEGWGNRGAYEEGRRFTSAPAGRWPANVVLDGDQADALDQQSGSSRSNPGSHGDGRDNRADWRMPAADGYGDSGGASRFFPTFRYQAKAPTRERPSYTRPDGTKVAHPTVKPVELMRWLVRLVTPPGGTVLDPFAGSGATVEACLIEGFDCIAIERDAESLPLIAQRIDRQAGTLRLDQPA